MIQAKGTMARSLIESTRRKDNQEEPCGIGQLQGLGRLGTYAKLNSLGGDHWREGNRCESNLQTHQHRQEPHWHKRLQCICKH